jgi:hypothetical protein
MRFESVGMVHKSTSGFCSFVGVDCVIFGFLKMRRTVMTAQHIATQARTRKLKLRNKKKIAVTIRLLKLSQGLEA